MELLIVRAVRYQWKVALSVFVCGLLAAYVAHAFGFGDRTSVAVAVPVLAAAPASAPSVPAIVAPAPDNTPLMDANSATAKQMQRWRASIRYLDARIEEARLALPDPSSATTPPAPAAEPNAPAAPAEEPVVVVPSQEEVALRRSVAEQKRRLDSLRAVDTEMHPDVIEANERLEHLQSQLVLLERRLQRERQQRERPAVVVQKPVQEAPPAPSMDAETQRIAMEHLADLIRQRAYLVTQMQRAAATSSTDSELAKELVPLLGPSSSPASQPSAAAVVPTPNGLARVPFLVIASLLSVLLAVVVASCVEASQGHLAGPAGVQASLPDGATFLGIVPRMRRQ